MLRSSFALFTLVACGPPAVGDCDRGAVAELAYDRRGIPSFAGQAQMIRSCGGGAYCHAAEVADPLDRFGAPDPPAFDVTHASLSWDPEPVEIERLGAHQAATFERRHEVLARARRAHASEEARLAYRSRLDSTFERVAGDGVTFTALPEPDTVDGYELLRNWLACGAPVVERVVPRRDGAPSSVGFTVPACVRRCADLTWPSLYEHLFRSTCTTSRCHDTETALFGLDWESGGASGAYTRVLDQPAQGAQCAPLGLDLLTAGDPDRSLIYAKVSASEPVAICGNRMPAGGSRLPDQYLCALRVWIECGACPEADGGACGDCVLARRAECNVRLVDGRAECVEPIDSCATTFPL